MPTEERKATAEAVASILANRVPEGRSHEYKSALPGTSDRDVKEFLADVTSFANTSGGLLLVGVREEEGLPVEVVGLPGINCDAEIARLDAMVRDGVEPRIPSIQISPVQIEDKVLIAVEISRSWASPHVVTARNHWRFYARNSSGKYPLDVGELRAAIEYSASSRERIQATRNRRLSAIAAAEGPVPLEGSAVLALHVIPFNSLDPGFSIDLGRLAERRNELRPVYASSWSYRYCLDGYMTYSHAREPSLASGYTLVMREGIIEATDTELLRPWEEKRGVPSGLFEYKILEALPAYLRIQRDSGVRPPLVIYLSLLRVRGYSMYVDASRFRHAASSPIREDELLLPGATIDSFEVPIAALMRPLFDTLWNAFGYERSFNYSEAGEWTGNAR